MCYSKPGPRCSGHASEELEEAGALLRAVQGNPDSSLQEEADAFKVVQDAYKVWEKTPEGIEHLRERGQSELADQYEKERQSQIDEYHSVKNARILLEGVEDLDDTSRLYYDKTHNAVYAQDVDGLATIHSQRVENPEFYYAVDLQEKHYKLRESAQAKVDELEERLVPGESSSEDYEELRQAHLRLRDENEKLDAINKAVNKYNRDTNYVMYQKENFSEFDTPLMSDVPEGFRAVDSASEGLTSYEAVTLTNFAPTAFNQRAELAERKVAGDDTSERERGWESTLVDSFAESHPDLAVERTQRYLISGDNNVHIADMPGIVKNEEGGISAVVNTVSTSRQQIWGNPDDGISAIPKHQRQQLLWNMHAAGVDEGYIQVVFNNKEQKTYHLTLDESTRKEQATLLRHSATQWANIQASRNGNTRETPHSTRIAKGFSQAEITGSWDSNARAALMENLCAYRDQKPEEIKAEYTRILGSPTQRGKNPEEVKSALRRMYTDFDTSKRQRPFMGIDLETTNMTPQRGRIIEAGVSIQDSKSQEIGRSSTLFGISKVAEYGQGVGAQDVHNISLSDIQGKETFDNPRVQERLLSQMKKSVLVAHNKEFEHKWFQVNIKGYREAYDKGEISFMDTRKVVQNLYPDAPAHRLQNFVEVTGGEYKDAHRAYNDVQMMMSAFWRSEKQIRDRP